VLAEMWRSDYQHLKSELYTEKAKTKELSETWRVDFHQVKSKLETEKAKSRELE
jgi:hypothetical protein